MLAVSVASCAAVSDYKVFNRSDQLVVIAPGLSVEPCGAASWNSEVVREAGEELLKFVLQGDYSWVPSGAVILEGLPPEKVDQSKPITIVVSGTNPVRVHDGPLPESQLPACGGAAILK